MVQMSTHLRCLLFHGWRPRGSRVLARIGGLHKTQNAVNGRKVADNATTKMEFLNLCERVCQNAIAISSRI